jgi:hypothetical protein
MWPALTGEAVAAAAAAVLQAAESDNSCTVLAGMMSATDSVLLAYVAHVQALPSCIG